MSSLLSIYIACAIFGVGVTTIDMLGLLGDMFNAEEGDGDGGDDGGDHGFDSIDGGHGDDDGGFDSDDGEDGDADGGFDAHDGGGHGDDHGDFDAAHGDHDGGHHGNEHGHHEHIVSHDQYQGRQILPMLLSTARSAVHFSLGFGSVGTFAMLTGYTPTSSLLWSIPVGAVTLVGGRVLRRIQRSELDSQFKAEDLIMERGKVLVSIEKGQLGKVRIQAEGSYADRYARASDPAKMLKVGTPVRVVDVTDDCVYVEEEPMVGA